MDRSGYKAKEVAAKYNAKYATTNFDEIIKDENVDLVMICTRHDSHANLTLKALNAGKNVFVEKPLATTFEELSNIKEFYNKNNTNEKPILLVGFNRRFSLYAQEIKKHTDKRINPLFIHYRMNAGYIPRNNWVHEYGGRIVGEACHIIDLMNFFTESKIKSISFESLTPNNNKFSDIDNKSIIIKYEDGSVCTIEYFSVGNKNFPKEYMELHFDEKTIVLDDYKVLKGYGLNITEIKSQTSQKGHLEELIELFEILIGKENKSLTITDIFQTTEATFLIN